MRDNQDRWATRRKRYGASGHSRTAYGHGEPMSIDIEKAPAEAIQHAVGVAMRTIIADISECHWAAGWYSGIEFIVWDAMQNDGTMGGYTSGPNALPALRILSDLAGGWTDSEKFVPMDEWRRRLDTRLRESANV